MRFTLFETLGLRHLCCKYDDDCFRTRYDEEQAAEIEEEDRDLMVKFDALLPQAQLEWENSSKSSLDSGATSREKILTYVDEPDEDNLQKITEMGVRIEAMGDSAEEKSLDDYFYNWTDIGVTIEGQDDLGGASSLMEDLNIMEEENA